MDAELIRIKASAGAGKTYQLALRYLRLLKLLGPPCGESLRSVVAITFTNKAAAEMKERILLFLKEMAFETEKGKDLSQSTGLSSELAARWVETIVGSYTDFQVRTIDSFLYSMLKGLSFELRMHPESEVLFNREPLVQRAFDIVMWEEREEFADALNHALKTFFNVEDYQGFYPESRLRGRILRLLNKVNGPLANAEVDWEKRGLLESELKERLQRFINTLEPVKESLNGNKVKGVFSKNGGFLNPSDLSPKDIAGLEKLSVFSSQVEELFKKSAQPTPRQIAEIRAAKEALIEGMERWKRLEAELRGSGYASLINLIQEEVEKICLSEGIVAGGEWTRIVSEKMRNPETVLFVFSLFGGRFRHFLFDEFQDTARDQWEALYPVCEEALSKGGSIFIVGDVKQAIYRWRGGDWRLFDEVVGRDSYFPMAKSVKEEVLSGNFRSHPELVGFFNGLFSPLTSEDQTRELMRVVLPKASDRVIAEASKAISDAFSSHLQSPQKDFAGPATIRLYRCEGYGDEISDKVKATFLERVEEEWSKRGRDADRTQVAVLVRTKDQAREVSAWLLHHGIPVVTEDSLRLEASFAVKGLICLLRYLFNGEDTAALYGFLSSGLPQNALTEKELFVAWKRKKGMNNETRAFFNDLCSKVDRVSPYELLQRAIEGLGLEERFKDEFREHLPFVERLLEVVHNFEEREGPSLGRFLSFWEEGGMEERVGLPENLPAVRVLTIHKAKGLEFPVVFVPFTHWALHTKEVVEVHNGQLLVLGKEDALPLELRELKAEMVAQEVQELLNLLYVAVTRAEESLYLFITRHKSYGEKQVSAWLEGLLERSGVECTVEELS